VSSFGFAAVADTSPGILTGTQIPDWYCTFKFAAGGVSSLTPSDAGGHGPAPTTTGVLAAWCCCLCSPEPKPVPASECAICGPPGSWVQLTAARSNLAQTIFQLQSLEGGSCSGILYPLSQRPLAFNSTPAVSGASRRLRLPWLDDDIHHDFTLSTSRKA
jgi:hypothetical protein